MVSSRESKNVYIAMFVVLVVAIVSIAWTSFKQHSRANFLWNTVHSECVPDFISGKGPAPCASVDVSQGEAKGFVTYKDNVGKTQYLVLPTEKITGIESPLTWAPNATNYFARAWDDIARVNQVEHQTLPREDFALAVNSISARSQNQLHIHIDCIQPSVKSALERVGHIEPTWQSLPVPLAGHHYRAMWLPGSDLGERNPFRLLAESLADPQKEMAGHTLVLAGAERGNEPGFILLDGQASSLAVAVAPIIKLGSGGGEQLEDHSCNVAQH